jgi:cysteinyl-tRNA synthetase
MQLFNTLTKQLETIEPLTEASLRIYSCGPTVYDTVHIGNLSSFIFADMVRRTAVAIFGKCHHVMNFTDVDDKTIRRSHEVYPDLEPMAALRKLTDDCSQHFLTDMQAVGNSITSMQFTEATKSIAAMQKLITMLVTAGFAYITDDGVYFNIEAYTGSGKLYGQLTEISEQSTSNARIQNDEYDKASVHDFALWKRQKPGEPAWDFQLNDCNLKGRPGWHIECSAMSTEALGQPFDIHTGGIDLIFPHHENEIAQSTALAHDASYATIFAHNEHLLVDGQKMSKSLQNFYTLNDIVNKGFDPLAFRMLVLQSHYRNQAHFSWDNLQAAQNRLRDFQAMAVLRYQTVDAVHDASTILLNGVADELTDLLADDLNLPGVMQFLSQMSSQLQTTLLEHSGSNSGNSVERFETALANIDKLLGFSLSALPDITDDQKGLIAQRETARNDKQWAESDRLRDELLLQGVSLRDTPQRTIWQYTFAEQQLRNS